MPAYPSRPQIDMEGMVRCFASDEEGLQKGLGGLESLGWTSAEELRVLVIPGNMAIGLSGVLL